MRNLLFGLILAIACPSLLYGQAGNSCADFNQTIKTTYNFRPALLANEAERDKKSAAMDRIWEAVKANRDELLPCLKRALEDPQADAWFRFDGSNLLVSLDPSSASKALQIKSYAGANLDDVDLRVWVTALVQRGLEGFDLSEAGERWLSYPKARYFLPEHGAYEVKTFEGALFIFGSMDEAQSVPALIKIINKVAHPGREVALMILMNEATPESLRALREIDVSGFSSDARNHLRDLLAHPRLIEPRTKPKTTRSEFLQAFEALLNGNPSSFFDLVDKVPDGEKDVVATLTEEDLPLVRRVRRRMIAGGNQHAIEFYESFTQIIRTMMLKHESTRPSQ